MSRMLFYTAKFISVLFMLILNEKCGTFAVNGELTHFDFLPVFSYCYLQCVWKIRNKGKFIYS